MQEGSRWIGYAGEICWTDRQFVLQTMELARNPAMLQELMRSQDRAMSNLEVGVHHLDLTPTWCLGLCGQRFGLAGHSVNGHYHM